MRKENYQHEAHHPPDLRGVAAWIGALMANTGHLNDPAYRAYGAIVIDGDDADLEEFLPKDSVTELAEEHSESSDRTQGLPAGSFKELHDKLRQVASDKASTEKFLDAFMSGWDTSDGESALKAS